jgi:hypothetical protein
VYLSGLISRHTEMGFNNPLDSAPPLLDRVMAGIKRLGSLTPSKPKLPITTAMLQAMLPHLDLTQRSDSLLWAMMWTATAGLLRISEFASASAVQSDRVLELRQLTLYDFNDKQLDLSTISPTSGIKQATLHLDASKTDPFRSGVDIIIASPTAIRALRCYLLHIRSENASPTTPLFMFSDKTAVKRSWLMKRVSALLARVGHHPEHYSSHSFRKGGAVSLQKLGVADSIIRRIGRWKSDVFHTYVRDPALETLVAANARL